MKNRSFKPRESYKTKKKEANTYRVFSPRHNEVLAAGCLQARDADVGQVRVGTVAHADGVRDGDDVHHVAELVGVDQVVLVLAHHVDDGVERVADGSAFFLRLSVRVAVAVVLVVGDQFVLAVRFRL